MIIKKEMMIMQIMDIDINDIHQDINQPRRFFDANLIEELAQSLKLYGILQPLIVKENHQGYIIIAGERRFRAAQAAGLSHLPCIIREKDSMSVSLIENIQREQLSPLDEAVAIKEYMLQKGLTQSQAAAELSKSRSYIANRLRLLKLDKQTISALQSNLITEGHAKTVLGVQSPAERDMIVKRILRDGLSVRETEKMVRESKKSKNYQSEDTASHELRTAEDELTEILGTKVTINGSSAKGSIQIEYYSKDQLLELSDILLGLREK